MDSPRRQRRISLCQPHSTTPHPSRAGVPSRPPFPSHVPFLFATYRHRPNPRFPWFSDALEPLCGPCHTPVLAPCPHPTPHPVFIPRGAASNPVARAHRILIHPGTVSCSLHGSLLSSPPLPRTRRALLRTFLSGSSGHCSYVMAPLAHLCFGTRTQRDQAAVA